MDPKEYIQKYGGKIGGHVFLGDLGGFEEFLPRADILDWDQGFDDIPDKSRYITSSIVGGRFIDGIPVVVRGSHPNDHEGLVDIIDSKKDCDCEVMVRDAIDRIRENASHPSVKSYSEYEGQPYDGRIRIMIADQLKDGDNIVGRHNSPRGSIIEHPHERGTYIIELGIATYTDHVYFERAVVKDGEIVHCMGEGAPCKLSDLGRIFDSDRYKEIIDLYQLVEMSGFIPEDTSFQMEFGYQDEPPKGKAHVQFFQARPFKKFEKPQFRLDHKGRLNYTTFGITPEEGILLPVKVSRGHNMEEVMAFPEPFVLIIENDSKSQPASFQPRNMQVYFAMGTRAASLEHNHYRWARKAKVSVLDNKLALKFRDGGLARIISDGIHAVVEKAA